MKSKAMLRETNVPLDKVTLERIVNHLPFNVDIHFGDFSTVVRQVGEVDTALVTKNC